MPKVWVIRNDDVLLVTPITGAMKNATRVKTYFDHFKVTDKIMEKNNLHCILSILAEGIDVYPEWVRYINERKSRYKIDMHGWNHEFVHRLTEEEGYEQLARAKEKIERAFGIEVKHWYVPNGRHYFPKWGRRVCDRLGIQHHLAWDSPDYFQYPIHYWNTRDQLRLQRLIENKDIKFYPVTQESDLTKPYVA